MTKNLDLLILSFGLVSICQSVFGLHFLMDAEDVPIHQHNYQLIEGGSHRLKRFAELNKEERNKIQEEIDLDRDIDLLSFSRAKRSPDMLYPDHIFPYEGGLLDEAIEDEDMDLSQINSLLGESEGFFGKRRRRDLGQQGEGNVLINHRNWRLYTDLIDS